jgi:hypothetical protein
VSFLMAFITQVVGSFTVEYLCSCGFANEVPIETEDIGSHIVSECKKCSRRHVIEPSVTLYNIDQDGYAYLSDTKRSRVIFDNKS